MNHLFLGLKVSAMLETFCQSLSTSNTNVVPRETACILCEQQNILTIITIGDPGIKWLA